MRQRTKALLIPIKKNYWSCTKRERRVWVKFFFGSCNVLAGSEGMLIKRVMRWDGREINKSYLCKRRKLSGSGGSKMKE